MGTLIDLAAHREARRGAEPALPLVAAGGARFSFDVVSPFTYLAAERVERAFPDAEWCATDPGVPTEETWTPRARRQAEHRAEALRMPLKWPEEREIPRESRPEQGRAVRRASAYADAHGVAPAFVIAVGRLAFCGAYDPDSPGVIIYAAEAARLSTEACLAAAADPRWDEELRANAERVAPCELLPVLEVGGRWFPGEHRLPEAMASVASLTG